MPAAVAAIVGVFTSFAGAISTFASTIFGSNLLLLGISIGLSYLSALLFRPPQPKPEDVQTILKNPIAPRMRHYGRVMTSGALVFVESSGSSLHKVLAIGTGQIDAFEQFWIDDKQLLSIGGDGTYNEDHTTGKIFWRYGQPTETYYDELEEDFPEWDTSHRGDGVASIYASFRSPKDPKFFSSNWPNGSNVQVRAVIRGAFVYNPSSDTVTWNDNAANIIRDFMLHQDGMRLSQALFATPEAHAGWIAAEIKCAEAVSLAAGGTEPRYRLWGTYQFDERPADILGRMLVCCDARVVPTQDGGITLNVGSWSEPTVVIDADTITGFAELSRGRDILSTANVISSTYTSPEHDYQSTDATPWRDEEDISLRGEVVKDQPFNMSPSHSQTRRLMKLEAWRANPSWIGTFQCNLKGLAAFGHRLVRITYPLFDIDAVFEVLDFRFNIGEGQILSGVTLQVQSMPSDAYSWNPAEEEGSSPIKESTTVDRTIPVPTGLTFDYERILVGGTLLPVGILTVNPPPDTLRLEGRYKRTGEGEEDWQPVFFETDAVTAKTGVLADGEEYEAQVRHMTMTGRTSDWSASVTLSAISDPTPPGQVTDATGETISGDAIELSWTNPNSLNFVGVRIYHNTVNNFGTSTLIHTEYGAPGSDDFWVDEDPA